MERSRDGGQRWLDIHGEDIPESVFTLTSFQRRFFNLSSGCVRPARRLRPCLRSSARRCRRTSCSLVAETGAAGGGPVAVIGRATAFWQEETWRLWDPESVRHGSVRWDVQKSKDENRCMMLYDNKVVMFLKHCGFYLWLISLWHPRDVERSQRKYSKRLAHFRKWLSLMENIASLLPPVPWPRLSLLHYTYTL